MSMRWRDNDQCITIQLIRWVPGVSSNEAFYYLCVNANNYAAWWLSVDRVASASIDRKRNPENNYQHQLSAYNGIKRTYVNVVAEHRPQMNQAFPASAPSSQLACCGNRQYGADL